METENGAVTQNYINSVYNSLVLLSLCALKTEKAVNKAEKAEGRLGGQE